MKFATMFVAALLAAPMSAQAATVSLEHYVDTTMAVPGLPGATFQNVLTAPKISNGIAMMHMNYETPSVNGSSLYTATADGIASEVSRRGDVMPDGVDTINQFEGEGFDIDGSSVLFTVERTDARTDTIILRRNGVDEIILEEDTTAIPGAPTDTFGDLAFADPFPLDGENFVFEALGSGGQRGVYAYYDDALIKIAETGDISPNGTPFAVLVTDPSISGDTILFQSRTDGGTVRGL